MGRDQFKDLFKTVFGKPIKSSLKNKLDYSESIRDKVVHGKNPKDAEIRKGVAETFEFCQQFNKYVYTIAGFNPMSKLSGFKGRTQSLDQSTTRWLLKGMGFNIS